MVLMTSRPRGTPCKACCAASRSTGDAAASPEQVRERVHRQGLAPGVPVDRVRLHPELLVNQPLDDVNGLPDPDRDELGEQRDVGVGHVAIGDPARAPYLINVSASRLSMNVSTWVPSAATTDPSPHALIRSSSVNASTLSAIALSIAKSARSGYAASVARHCVPSRACRSARKAAAVPVIPTPAQNAGSRPATSAGGEELAGPVRGAGYRDVTCAQFLGEVGQHARLQVPAHELARVRAVADGLVPGVLAHVVQQPQGSLTTTTVPLSLKGRIVAVTWLSRLA